MADSKISDLVDGGDLQATDELPLARSGTTVRTNGTGILDFLTPSFDSAGAAAAAQAASQPLDSDLTAIAALSTTSFGRALLTLADAAALRTTAALVIGTNVEAWDADLDDIAALTPTNDDIVQRKAGHWTNRTMAQLISDLAALGTTFQPLDSDLTAIAALTTTAFGRGLLTAANAAGLGITAADVGALGATAAAGGDLTGNYPNPTIGSAKVTVAKLAAAVTLDAIAAANATGADISMNSHKITNLTNGSGAQDAAAFGQIPTALPPNGSAGGDLSGTYPNPAVAKITETSGPTDLTIGTIADGQFLKRSGSTLISGTAGALDQYPNTYITVADETIPANTQVIYEDFLELSASFEYELASGAILIIGDFYTPAFPPGYEIGYSQITAGVNVVSTSEATGTPIISPPPFTFDGGPVLLQFFTPNIKVPTNAVGAEVVVSLFEGATQITELTFSFTYATAAQNEGTVTSFYRFTPTAGIHTYSITAFTTNTTGTPAVGAGTGVGANLPPAFVRFTKV